VVRFVNSWICNQKSTIFNENAPRRNPNILKPCKIVFYATFPRELMPHTVFCVKFKKEMPGLDEPPFDNELGKKVYDNVSQEAWRMWMEHCKMLLNEYRLNPARREDQEVIVKQMELFFFGEGSAKPKEYVPPAEK